MDRERLEYLIGGFCDHSFTAEEAAELNAYLTISEEARRRFVVLVDQHRQLSEWLAAGAATGGRASLEAQVLERPDTFTPRTWMAAAAVFLLSLLAGILWWNLWLPVPQAWSTAIREAQPGRLAPPERPFEE
jgi:hypothetical protein